MKRKEILKVIGFEPDDKGNWHKEKRVITKDQIIHSNKPNWKGLLFLNDFKLFVFHQVKAGAKYVDLYNISKENFINLHLFDALFRQAFDNK